MWAVCIPSPIFPSARSSAKLPTVASAAEVDLARRGEIAQVDAVRRKADKRRLRVLHLRGNGLHRPVRQLALRERDTGLISAEYPSENASIT